MTTDTIALRDLEDFYDLLAESVDRATPDKATLFLAKLALQLASEVRDPVKLRRAVEIALLDL
jgi:hypothetical protein